MTALPTRPNLLLTDSAVRIPSVGDMSALPTRPKLTPYGQGQKLLAEFSEFLH